MLGMAGKINLAQPVHLPVARIIRSIILECQAHSIRAKALMLSKTGNLKGKIEQKETMK